ncbi:MAG: type II toxin-antitoxin system prevent-host-death family antitoxin [Acidobacteriaceae bacterium]
MEVTAAYAKAHLPELLKIVEKGKTVTISRYRKPVAEIVPLKAVAKPARKFGTGKGQKIVIDPNWDKPIETEKELLAFFKGRF